MCKKHLVLIVSSLLAGAFRSVADAPFDPIPDVEESHYKFNFAKWFYTDEEVRQKDFSEVKRLSAGIAALKGEVTTKPTSLLSAIEGKQRAGVIADKLRSYGGLRLALDVTNPTAQQEEREGDEVWDKLAADTMFIKSAVQSLDEAALRSLIAAEPGLVRYEFLMRSWRAERQNSASAEVEAALAGIGSNLDPFGLPFRTLMINRSPDPVIAGDSGDLNVTVPGDYARILRLDDRDTREKGFRKRMATYKAQEDLFAFALFRKALTANAVAGLRNFANASDEALIGSGLKVATVDAVLKGFRDHADLAIRFQIAEKEYQAKLLKLASAQPWDIEARPSGFPEPRFTIGEAEVAVVESTKLLGRKYTAELEHLFDPSEGRLDLVPGQNRRGGDFTWGYWGDSWLLYMQGYNGYLADAVVLAHESAHVAHYRLIHKAGVPWCYGDGARYFTEGFAKVNELLILNHLAQSAGNDAERLFYLRQINSKLLSVKFTSMYWAAYATSFEIETYRRVKSGQAKVPGDIHDIWGEFGRLWTHDFDKFPDLKYVWPETPHFLNSPRVYSDYLFAWVISLSIYERLKTDPAAAARYLDLMEGGFPDEPAVLLRKHLDVDLADPATLHRMFALAEKQLVEFEVQVRKLK